MEFTFHFCLFYQTEVNSKVIVGSTNTNLGNDLFCPFFIYLLKWTPKNWTFWTNFRFERKHRFTSYFDLCTMFKVFLFMAFDVTKKFNHSHHQASDLIFGHRNRDLPLGFSLTAHGLEPLVQAFFLLRSLRTLATMLLYYYHQCHVFRLQKSGLLEHVCALASRLFPSEAPTKSLP